jgi:hypothetical protein
MSGQLGSIPYPQAAYDDSGNTVFLGATDSQPVQQPAQPAIPTTWAPSNWRPGMPPTSMLEDRSQWPMPTQDQVEAQRQTLYGNMTKAGWRNPQLSDQQVLSTMSNLPMGPAAKLEGSPQWFQDWAQQNPQAFAAAVSTGARAGVDMPTNQTYDPANLKSYTSVGYANSPTIPRAALVAHYGEAKVQEMEQQDSAARTAQIEEQARFNARLYQEQAARERQPGYMPSFFHVDAQGNKTVVPPPAGFQPNAYAPSTTPPGSAGLAATPATAPGAPVARPLSYATAAASPAQSVVPVQHPFAQQAIAQARQEVQQPLDFASYAGRYWNGQRSQQAMADYQQYRAFLQRHPSDPELQQWIRNHASEQAYARLLSERDSGVLV